MEQKDLSSKIFGWISIIAFMLTILCVICIFAFGIMVLIMRYQGIKDFEQFFYPLNITNNIGLISFVVWLISSIGFRLARK